MATKVGVAENAFFKGNCRFSSSETYIPDGAEKAAHRADFPGRPAYDVEDEKVRPEKGVSDRTRASNARTSFDWDEFINKVRVKNDAVYSQLVKTKYEFAGDTLHIYPMKKIVKNILARENNKRILLEAADGVKITIHEADETPSGEKKDVTLDKISAIMGGEVTNDGGGNPFE